MSDEQETLKEDLLKKYEHRREPQKWCNQCHRFTEQKIYNEGDNQHQICMICKRERKLFRLDMKDKTNIPIAIYWAKQFRNGGKNGGKQS
jgi:hypothetical protein